MRTPSAPSPARCTRGNNGGGPRCVYARAATLAPQAFEWRYLDAVVLQRLARHADAVARLREALSLSPGYLPARVKLAEALLESGELAESKSALHRAGQRASRDSGRRSRARANRGGRSSSTTRPSRTSSAP